MGRKKLDSRSVTRTYSALPRHEMLIDLACMKYGKGRSALVQDAIEAQYGHLLPQTPQPEA